VNLTLANVKDGQTAHPSVECLLCKWRTTHPPAQAGHWQAAVNGNFNFTLNADLKPAPVTGQARLDVSHATVCSATFPGQRRAGLRCDPAQIKQAVLHFQRRDARWANWRQWTAGHGQNEGRLRWNCGALTGDCCLAGAAAGIDFGNNHNQFQHTASNLDQGGTIISAPRAGFDAGPCAIDPRGANNAHAQCQCQLRRHGGIMPAQTAGCSA